MSPVYFLQLLLRQRLLLLILASVVYAAQTAELRLKPGGESQTKALGSSVVFTCEVIGGTGGARETDVDHNLKWTDKNGREITDTVGTRIYVEEESRSSKKLYITGIERDDEGKYTCIATIAGVAKQNSVTLLLFQDITFDHAPAVQHPLIYTDTLIECRVSGSGTVKVDWRYQGRKIITGRGSRYEMDTHGLRIKNVTRSDDGEYRCRAEVEIDGRYDDRKITVMVHIPPAITKGPAKLTEDIEGNVVSIHCNATGLPAPLYEFYKDNNLKPVVSNERITVDGDAGVIRFKPVKYQDAGSYKCRVINDAGIKEASGILKVYVKPIVNDFKDITGVEGRLVKLICQSTGEPAPEMTFRKTTRPRPYSWGENENGRIIVRSSGNGHLEMTIGLSHEDAGNYTCRSSNKVGYNESTAQLTVHFAPRFTTMRSSHSIYIWPGKTRNLTCEPLAEPAPSFEWIKRQRFLENNDTYHIFNTDRNSNLQVRMRDIGQSWIFDQYVCKVRNQFGQGEIIITLHEARPPGAPLTVNVTVAQPNSLRLQVNMPPTKEGELPILGYRIECESLIQDFESDSVIELKNLKPSTQYLVTVRAKSEVGVGAYSSKLFRTASVRTPYPLKLTSSAAGNMGSSYRVIWDAPNTGGIPVQQYEFKYRKRTNNSESSHFSSDKSSRSVSSSQTSDWTIVLTSDNAQRPIQQYDLLDLEPETEYDLEVKVKNGLGWSESSSLTFHTVKVTEGELLQRQASFNLKIILIVLFVVLVLAIIVDVVCFIKNKRGLTALICLRIHKGKSKNVATEQREGKVVQKQHPKDNKTEKEAELLLRSTGNPEKRHSNVNGLEDKENNTSDNARSNSVAVTVNDTSNVSDDT